MPARKKFSIGDRVDVPWGFGTIPGEIQELYGPPGHEYALVRVPIRGASGEELDSVLVTFLVTDLGKSRRAAG